jgi:hypothetical protein
LPEIFGKPITAIPYKTFPIDFHVAKLQRGQKTPTQGRTDFLTDVSGDKRVADAVPAADLNFTTLKSVPNDVFGHRYRNIPAGHELFDSDVCFDPFPLGHADPRMAYPHFKHTIAFVYRWVRSKHMREEGSGRINSP